MIDFLNQHFAALVTSLLLLVFMVIVSRQDSVIGRLILALNSLNTPLMAISVIILGCAFSILSKVYGMNAESAAGIIGAGIGLLTGQALSKTTTHTQGGQPTEVQQTTGAPTVAETFHQPS